MGTVPAYAQDDQQPAPAAANGDAQVFEPAYFAQFAPRNALDMVDRIPGFSISGGNDQGQRGLGQATQNVIVNGARLSSKSESVRDQLRRIPATDVVRIEILDGNATSIPGLTGQVANVVYTSNGASGQFEWTTGFRPHNTEAQLFGGEISVIGSSGALDYTVSLSNENNRFGADGPVSITDRDGALIESQYSKLSGKFDNPKISTAFSYDFGGDVTANLNLSYGSDFFSRKEPETAIDSAGVTRTREALVEEDGPEYELGGDIQFPFGPGSLKLILLERFERDNYSSIVIDRLSDDSPPRGFRFEQTNGAGERIGRLEYDWKLWGADWQLSGEAAFNRLDRRSRLFELAPGGEFVQLAFPQGNGGVTEDRYDASLSISRSLSSTFSVQVIGAMEFSTIEQTGFAANSRSFKRPKGSFAATWKPRDDFDISVTLAKRVSQLSFGDFLASVSLNNDNQNGGNNELVPYQSYNVEIEANKTFGAWGSLKLEARKAWFEDFIDWFPLPGGGEARGNIGDADRLHLEANATINLDPLGFRGARVDLEVVKRDMNVIDPFTGLNRPFSYDQEGSFEIDFRHDVPGTDWAWGANLDHFDQAPYARRFEIGREWEGKVFGSLFIEHKDVLGLTVRARANNLLGARDYFRRTVFDGPRPEGAVRFEEYRSRRIGPIFRLTVSGDF
ncbi:TonB-dependent receptor plug domain-containing protein [Qipengyuania flava]|nr:TonB-dependent receptor plug domain-containing protein [Qipengyuania flava]MBY5964771.1 TonB-dependent receptor plug domain-containing protein [Qipengyuania flava]MBY6011095.1 TonB-dependent receptor plug domain-containing protein [Qipengyuania flava]MBY6025537.1 TonB-dependent receptor plug domain-containing protein [Qipengyuania flava]